MSNRFKRIWGGLTEPAPEIREPNQRRNARFLSSLLLIVVPLGYLIAIASELLTTSQPIAQDPSAWIMTIAISILAIGYLLSRTRHFQWSVWLCLVIGFFAIYTLTIIDRDPSLSTLYYLLILCIFSSHFLSTRLTLGLLAVWLAASLAMPLFSPVFTFGQVVSGPATFLVIGSSLVLVITWHRDQVEKDRRAALQASEARYRTLAEAAPDMIFILDRSGTVQYVNEYGARQVNLRPKDIVGQSSLTLFPHMPGSEVQEQNTSKVLETGQALYLESQPQAPQRELWLGTWLVPLRNDRGQVTEVLGVARDITQLKRATQVQTAVYRISEAAQATRHLDDLYRSIHTIVSELMPAENFYIALYDPMTDLITFPYLVDQYEDDVPVKPGKGLTSYVLRTGQPILFTPEVHNELVERGEIVTMGRPSYDWLGAPLKTSEHIIGVVAVQTYDPNIRLHDSDKELLVFVSSQIAMAIERKRAAEAEHEQRILAEALRDTASTLTSTLDLDEVLDRILSNVGQVAPHDALNIMLLDAEQTHANIVRARGYLDLGPLCLKLADFPVIRGMLDTKQPLVVEDTRSFPGWVDRPQSHWIRSHLGVPIHYNEQMIGILNADSARPNFFTLAHAEHLQAFADQAAIALENARLHQALNQHAVELERRVQERTRQLADANDRLQELDRMKDQFVSNVSHELRTPIANIKLYLSLLTMGKPEKRADYMKTLQHETARLENLIEDLLELSRLDLDIIAVNLVPIDVNGVVASLVVDRTLLAADRGLRLTHDLQPDLPLVQADPLRLEQVIANLLANAMNYTPPGGYVQLRTALRDVDACHWITVTVADSGPGIAPRDLPNLFDRFYRGEVGRKSGTPGTGLGLAICQEIMIKLNGRITVESALGHGACFTVWLKL